MSEPIKKREADLITDLLDAWRAILEINPHARENGGKTHRWLWACLDELTELRRD